MSVFARVKLGYKNLLLTVCNATLGGPSLVTKDSLGQNFDCDTN